jgi:peptidyl-prolyl cis-trans isomerase C
VSKTVRTLVLTAAGFILSSLFALAQQPAKPAAPAAKPAAASPEAAKATAPEETIPAPGPDALFPAVVARVNGRALLGRDLETKVRSQLAPIGNPAWKNLREDYRQELTAQALGSLLASELLYQKAIAEGTSATDGEVKTEFEKLQKTFASDAEMNLALADRGTDRAGVMKELQKSLIVAKYIQENITKKVAVAPNEVQEYYNGHTEDFRHPDVVRSSHILIIVPESATQEQRRAARQRAEGLLARVKKGEDFAKLAKEYSQDSSASQGGDIGYVPKGQLAAEYEATAFTLPVGSVSDVVQTQFGFHIIKVTDRKKAGVSTLDEIRTELTEFLKGQKVDAEVDKLVQQLRQQAKIEILIGTAATPKR